MSDLTRFRHALPILAAVLALDALVASKVIPDIDQDLSMIEIALSRLKNRLPKKVGGAQWTTAEVATAINLARVPPILLEPEVL